MELASALLTAKGSFLYLALRNNAIPNDLL